MSHIIILTNLVNACNQAKDLASQIENGTYHGQQANQANALIATNTSVSNAMSAHLDDMNASNNAMEEFLGI